MLKVELSHVVKTVVDSLLPAGSGDAMLVVALRIDTWLNVDEAVLTPEVRMSLQDRPDRFDQYCQLTDRFYDVFVFCRPMAYTQVWRRQASDDAGLELSGTYDKIADHDSTWFESIDAAHERALKAIEKMHERVQFTVEVQHQARLRPGQHVHFAQTPALLTGLRVEQSSDQLILHPQQK